MNLHYPDPILNEAIEKLPFSEEFRLVTETLGFYKLADLLHHHITELIALPGFDHRLWNEYAEFLEKHRIGHYLN